MGSLFTKQSRNLPSSHQKNTVIDSSSYILGRNSPTDSETNHYRPIDSFDTNRLNFIPDSEKSWNSHLPKTRSIIQRPKIISDFPKLPSQFEHRNHLINMPTHQKCKCDQCGMVFPSNDALFRHKTRFCIGVKDSGIGRKPVYSDDEESDVQNHTKRSTEKKVVRHHSPVQKKRDEVNEWKRQRSILQAVEDIEGRVLLDTQKTQTHAHRIKKQDNIYNEILLEYERLQNQERDVLRQMYNLQSEPRASNHSSEKVKPMNDVTGYSKVQFEDLRRRNAILEQERRIIQQKLEELISTNYQPSTMSNYEPYQFLHSMKEQQELNEKALEFLRGRLIYPESSSFTTLSDVPSLPHINTGHTRLRQTGVNNVRSFPNSYLQSGGHDTNAIARYSDLERRLRVYEDDPWSKDYPEPLKQNRYQIDRPIDTTNERLKIANEENQRLQSELNELHKKFEKLDTRTKRLESSGESNVMSNSIDHQRHFSSRVDQYPISVSENHNDQFDQQQSSLHISDRRVTSRASPAMSLLASNLNKLRDPLAPRSYDPIGGFVIFFDFLVNLPLAIDQCCLITCLHHPKSGLGEPSQLESFNCEQYIDERSGERMCVALIATKQPVPRCPPQQALTIVLEIQTTTTTTGKQRSSDELKTNAWTKIPLFDNKNRLLSGRWKVPLKALPIHHEESLAVISTLPLYERAELHYRLVNSQDGDDQSITPLSPSFRELYRYPLPYRNGPPL